MLLPKDLLDKYIQEEPKPVKKAAPLADTIRRASALELDGAERFEKRRKMIAATAVEDFKDAFERYIGDNDLLPINYFEIGYLKSRAVGRLQFVDTAVNKPVVATGFLISGDLLITNYHVFPGKQSFRNAQVEFDFEYDISGKEKDRKIFALDPDKFFYANKQLDMAIVGVQPKDVTGSIELRSRGYLVLNGAIGKAGVGDFASIIQHPDGHPMQVSIRENRILDISQKDILIYSSDTSTGSSGAPVMNDQWQVLALHSAGVAKTDGNGTFLDEDDNPIPEIDGKIDGARVVWLNNKGIRISAIIDHLAKEPTVKDHPYIIQLFLPTYTDDKQLAFLSLPFAEAKAVSLPVAPQRIMPAESTVPNVYINISVGGKKHEIRTSDSISTAIPVTTEELALEKKIEDELDFSDCKGFDEYFMTERIPMPSLSDKLKRKIAYHVDNPNRYILKYHHYSTIHHAVRKMPVVSAINIYGKRRYAALEGRTDNWFRDRRLDFDVQLTDDFYKKSGFDKGHMSRREDAEWGNSVGFAEAAANMTCSYTNACPQVPDLNRAVYGYHGKWGQLEMEMLEKGVKGENGLTSRICVFNGPVFKDDDRHFKGIQIPLEFWKVVVWRDKASQLNTTGFMLSQEDLVSTIAFEELRFDEIFKTYQCSIEYIEKLTGLKFDKIREWDTFRPDDDGDERLLLDESLADIKT